MFVSKILKAVQITGTDFALSGARRIRSPARATTAVATNGILLQDLAAEFSEHAVGGKPVVASVATQACGLALSAAAAPVDAIG